MIKLLKAILSKNENAAYTQLASFKWNKEMCHVKESGLSRFGHALQSIACGWFFLKLALFCFIWHPIFPNIGPHWATKQLGNWDAWYSNLNVKLKELLRKSKVTVWKSKKKVDNLNPFSQMVGK